MVIQQPERTMAVLELATSVIIPAHNEQHRLAATLRMYGQVLRERYGDAFEILVVANGCTDATVQTALDVVATLPQVGVIDIQEPLGKGGAILVGFRHAQGQRVLFADADGATAPQSLVDLLDQLDHHDVVVGSRRLAGSVITHRPPWKRRASSMAFATAVRLLFGMPYQDTQCGAKAFHRDAAYRLARVVNEARWTFDVDLLLCAEALGLEIAEHPVVWTDKPGSRLRILPTLIEVIGSLWRLSQRHSSRVVPAPVPPAMVGPRPASARASACTRSAHQI